MPAIQGQCQASVMMISVNAKEMLGARPACDCTICGMELVMDMSGRREGGERSASAGLIAPGDTTCWDGSLPNPGLQR